MRDRLNLRLNSDCRSAIEQLSVKLNSSMTSVVLQAVEDLAQKHDVEFSVPQKTAPVKPRRAPLPDIPALEANARMLLAIGRNVNQLTKRSHQGDQIDLVALDQGVRKALHRTWELIGS